MQMSPASPAAVLRPVCALLNVPFLQLSSMKLITEICCELISEQVS